MTYSVNQWAHAIATRLSDEWEGKSDFPDDANLLKNVLTKALVAVPRECLSLVGTGKRERKGVRATHLTNLDLCQYI